MTAVVSAVTWDAKSTLHRSHSAADRSANHAADSSTDRAGHTIARATAIVGALLGAFDEALGMADARRCRESEDDSRRRTKN